MEYQFKVVHLQGKMNAVADALSRMNPPDAAERAVNLARSQPMTIQQIMNLQWQDSLRCNVVTRGATKAQQNELNELELVTRNTDHHDEPRPYELFVVHENNKLLTEMGDFHHAFYFFSAMNCRMRRKLETKLALQNGKDLNWPE